MEDLVDDMSDTLLAHHMPMDEWRETDTVPDDHDSYRCGNCGSNFSDFVSTRGSFMIPASVLASSTVCKRAVTTKKLIVLSHPSHRSQIRFENN